MTEQDLIIEMVAVDTLLAHPENPRRGRVDKIVESIKAHGFLGTLTAQTSTRHILIGNHRWRAAKEAGLTHVPVRWLDIGDEDAKRVLIIDNRTSDQAENDQVLLTQLLQSLAPTTAGLSGTGWKKLCRSAFSSARIWFRSRWSLICCCMSSMCYMLHHRAAQCKGWQA